MPPQNPDDIRAKVEKYLKEEFEKLHTKCTMKIEYLHGGIPWVADYKHWNYQAAKNATEVRSHRVIAVIFQIHFQINHVECFSRRGYTSSFA